ncbi:protease [Clostridium aceticum]|uniref:Protease n=1 Tax=Clostridium aceticum TaxID=84022 RepID=A0A0D8I5U8_9CLOT|nr:CPBP family intramembrane glutamic endopeptidase [Clostridium aceticum]AKL94344.1 protease [Clostridium aceticum]KJF25387.1 hypothetical protein TZ02_18995 [Clostridium aceticum]
MKQLIKIIWQITKYIIIFLLMREASAYVVSSISGYFITVDKIEMMGNGLLENLENISYGIGAVGSFFIYKKMIKSRNKSIYEVCRFKKLSTDQIILSIIVGVALVFLNGIILAMVTTIFPSSYEAYKEFADTLKKGSTVLFFLCAGIIGPLFEEVQTRGLILSELLRKISFRNAIIIQALIFGAMHMNLVQGIYATVIGVFCGYALLWTGSIWTSILIHTSGNIFSLIMARIVGEGFLNQPNSVMLVLVLMIQILALVIIPYIFNYFYKNRVEWEISTVEECLEK